MWYTTFKCIFSPMHPYSAHPDQFLSEEDQEDFRDFIVKLASLTYDNLETLPLNKSYGIPSTKYLELLYELKWAFEPEISSGAAVKMFIYETQTEFGICHSVNSMVARYNSFEWVIVGQEVLPIWLPSPWPLGSYWRSGDWSLMDHGDRVTVHPLDGEIYAQIINLSTAYDVYFHGAGDVPSISKQRYTFPESDYTTVELIALEIFTNEEARAWVSRLLNFRLKIYFFFNIHIYLLAVSVRSKEAAASTTRPRKWWRCPSTVLASVSQSAGCSLLCGSAAAFRTSTGTAVGIIIFSVHRVALNWPPLKLTFMRRTGLHRSCPVLWRKLGRKMLKYSQFKWQLLHYYLSRSNALHSSLSSMFSSAKWPAVACLRTGGHRMPGQN